MTAPPADTRARQRVATHPVDEVPPTPEPVAGANPIRSACSRRMGVE
jgi:hypothetical protein